MNKQEHPSDLRSLAKLAVHFCEPFLMIVMYIDRMLTSAEYHPDHDNSSELSSTIINPISANIFELYFLV
uniref:Uncharacterized protein n=1 Tax=Trichobilharzia regenti TaxID=157069 RepID=A0AA85K4E0_TRIRE|nr:unnamed protein product [Trichobilharzia regenti]